MGPKPADILYYLIHYNELRSIIQWKTQHNPVHVRDEEKESETLKRCFFFLDQTGRSFSMVIQELHHELLVPIALFYLVLRGLDTIEDDMTLPIKKKELLLRNFHNILEEKGWNFKENGENEKDRQLCVEFDVVIEEYLKIKPEYRKVIGDITKQMGNGMADYANNAEHHEYGVQSVEDYDLYCHYVAGLVGEGVTRLFVEAKLADGVLLERENLHDSMGLFLQKMNIIRDIREDFDEKRYFWPKEIWSKHVDKFEDLLDPKYQEKALTCSSELVLNALELVPDCLDYLAGLQEQSVFNFCAIPQTMAIATLETVFQNPKIFQKNVKITKGQACQIMIDSTQSLQLACEVFRKFTKKILKKNNPKDPNFLNISIAGAKVEQFIEKQFPTIGSKSPKDAATIQKMAKQKAADDDAKWNMVWIMASVVGILTIISALMVYGVHNGAAHTAEIVHHCW